jgi:hypothetical protein
VNMLGNIINLWWININGVIKENNSKLESLFTIISNLTT